MKEKTETILTTDLRNELKAMFANEIKNIPGYINEMQPKDKLDYLLKLMPFVLPKVDNVNHENGEPGEHEFKLFN